MVACEIVKGKILVRARYSAYRDHENEDAYAMQSELDDCLDLVSFHMRSMFSCN